MPCDDACELMAEALDNAAEGQVDEAGFETHLLGCEACRHEWRKLEALEGLLRAERLVEPPPNFGSRALARIAEESRRAPAWQRRLLGILAILAAVGGLASAIAGVVDGLPGPGRLAAATTLGRGLVPGTISFLDGLGAIVAGSGQAWLLYGLLAAALAMLWFAALVLPRTAPARSSTRRS